MPPNSPALAGVRPAAALNEDIRELARAAWGRPFTDKERARYQELRDEWVTAVRAEDLTAA